MSQEDSRENRRELFAQIQPLFALHARPLGHETIMLMQPLIDGGMNYEEHRAMLTAAIESLEV